ncbi:MAG: ABC transporter ATP-binding protein [Acidobacteria bacterium]|nr:ABC transporter ATP-binding protein [Acidobacteriota bacterium]
MSLQYAIDANELTKRFGTLVAVNRVSLKVSKGEICGFLGPNGSGKTTFIRMLCGLLRPDGGSGCCLGYDIIKEADLIKKNTGYMTQKFSFWEDLSIYENLDFVGRIYSIRNRKEEVARCLEQLGLYERRKQLAKDLSGGWKQRLALAACMIHNPQLIFLDEPTAGVDPKARREFWDKIHMLAGEGITFLISTHYMDEAERCHKLAFILYGNLLIQGPVSDVIDRSNLKTYMLLGPKLTELEEKIKKLPGVEQSVFLGNALHISGTDEAMLKESLSQFSSHPYQLIKVSPTLEDVFIHFIQTQSAGQISKET